MAGCQAPVDASGQASESILNENAAAESAPEPPALEDAAPELTQCKLTPALKYVLYVDGVLMGFASDYSITQEYVLLEKGLFPRGRYLSNWITFNSAGPKLLEKHDLSIREIVSIGEKGEVVLSDPIVEFRNSLISEIDGKVADDLKSCIVFRSIELKVDEVVKSIDAPL